jgi:hypothetical protein
MGTTSFVGRGRVLTERLLCQRTHPPPSDENTASRIMETEMDTAGMTPRQASEFRFGLEPICLSCHTQFEPIAYGFERYDQTGRYTPTDAEGRELFSDGTLPAMPGRPEIAFASAPDLLAQLAELESTQRCFVENMMEYGSGANVEHAEAFVDEALGDFTDGGLRFDALVEAVATNQRLTLTRNVAAE